MTFIDLIKMHLFIFIPNFYAFIIELLLSSDLDILWTKPILFLSDL